MPISNCINKAIPPISDPSWTQAIPFDERIITTLNNSNCIKEIEKAGRIDINLKW